MSNPLTPNLPPAIADLIQQGLLERAFHDSLFPTTQFRSEALREEWPANTGQEIVMSRPGLLAPVTTPLAPGAEPVPVSPTYEQWVATLAQYSGTIDTHMPSSATANADLFTRNVQQLGLQAGRSINLIARNALFKAYLEGQTVLLAATASTDTTIRVASISGFVYAFSSSALPKPVSPANPLSIRLGTGGLAATAIGCAPDDPNDWYGPGTILLNAQVGAVVPLRAPVISSLAPRIVRPAGGLSVDSITPSDMLILQQTINAVAYLRRANVQPHEDGFYHAHISPIANAQVFADPVFQRLNQSLPEYATYREGFIGHISGVAFFLNTDTPDTTNVGPLTATASGGFYARDIGAEIINGAGTPIGRTILTGRGALMEKYINEDVFQTEAGMNGKSGKFEIVNNGMAISTDLIRLIVRAPLDRLQQSVSASWSISTSFPVPSDALATSGPEKYKRAIVLEHAG